MTAKIVLSGMQPSGILHIGNYIGGILNWKKMIAENPNFQFNFMVADLHSLTSLKDARELRQNIIDTAACYAACGIDFTADNISIFQQSKISEHAHLAWIFQTITPMGWLERMTQFKDKVRDNFTELTEIENKINDIESKCVSELMSIISEVFGDGSLVHGKFGTLGENLSGSLYYWIRNCLTKYPTREAMLSHDNEKLTEVDFTEMEYRLLKFGVMFERMIFRYKNEERALKVVKKLENFCLENRYPELYQSETSRYALMKEHEEKKIDEKIKTGLFTYPALMAADILLYDADFVPVGNDQKQHIELTRDIAEKFNRTYHCAGFFKQPEPIISEGARIMSLADGRKKMSKSDPSELSRILLTDTDDEIAKKISKAKTDSIREIYYDKENRPDISNLITIAACLGEKTIETVENECKNLNTKEFKDMLSEMLIEKISPIRGKINEFRANDSMLKILADGNGYVKKIASKKIEKVNSLIGL